jgi:hypothetical protein
MEIPRDEVPQQMSINEVFDFPQDCLDKIEQLRAMAPLDQDQEVALCQIISRYLDPELGNLNLVQLLPADTGWGKTRVAQYAALILSHLFDMHPFVVCPANLRNQWRDIFKQLKITPIAILSYDEIRGQKRNTVLKHPFLRRNEEDFTATDQWLSELERGVFMIVDESQKLKNDSAQHFATIELIYTLCNTEPRQSRILHLTASFIDKPDNWKCLMRCFGYSKKTATMQMNPGTGQIMWRNSPNPRKARYLLGEVMAEAEKIDARRAADSLLAVNHQVSAKNLPVILNYLWVHVFRPQVVIPVTDPIYKHPETLVGFKRERYNGFYELEPEGLAKAMVAMRNLRAGGIVRDNGVIDMRAANTNFGVIQKALMLLCEAKLRTVVRLALHHLRTSNAKLVLCIPFIAGQENIFKELALYGPLILNGDVKMDDRPEVLAKFNEPNDKHRVIVMTPAVGGIGVSLHDTHGGFPRIFYGTPTYNFMDWLQASGRTWRRGLMSDVQVFMVYASNAPIEAILVNTMAKSAITNDVIIPGSGRICPGDFDIYIEEERKYPALRRQLNDMKVANNQRAL